MGKIYFISDTHEAYLIYANRHKINCDTYRALISVARYIVADDEEDKAVVFSGDNFDSKSPCPSDLVAFKEAVNIMTNAGIPVYGIEGNHDKVAARAAADQEDPEDLSIPFGGAQWIDLVDGVKSIDHKLTDILGMRVYGMDYIQGKQIYDELDKAPECDLLVLHQPFTHVSPFEANSLEVEGVPDQVMKGVVFGHVHISDKRKTSKDVWVVSPGATHSQKLTHPHGAFVIYDTEKNTFDFVETPEHRIMRRFVCKDSEELDEVDEELVQYTSEDDRLKPIIGIKYNEVLGDQVSKLKEKYKNTIHFFPRVVPDDQQQVTSEEIQDMSTEEILVRLFESLDFDNTKDDKILYDNALSMIEGQPEKVFAYIRKMEDERNEITQTNTA